MAGINRCTFIGFLGADPEVSTTPQGATVAKARLAVSETWKDQSGQRHERTEWVNLVLWRKQAEIAQRFLRKGSKIYVEGKLQTRSWEDKATGQKRYATDIVVDTFTMLDGKPGAAGEAPQGGGYASPAAPAAGDDDLPFN